MYSNAELQRTMFSQSKLISIHAAQSS